MQRKYSIGTLLFTALFAFATCAMHSSVAQQAPLGSAEAPLGGVDAPDDTEPDTDATDATDDAEDTEEDMDADVDIIPLAGDKAAQTAVDQSSEDLINVSVENETLENIVNMFTRISGANIVTSSADLEGTVTVNLRGVDWKSALSAILDIHDLSLAEQLPGSGVYTIVPKPLAEDVPLVVDTLFLHFTTVPEVQPILRSMLSVSNATISAFPSRNALIVRTSEPNMRQLKSMVESMDVPGDQVVVEAKFVELSDGSSKNIGINWDMLDDLELTLSTAPFGETRTQQSDSLRTRNAETSDNRTRTTARTINDQDGQEVLRLFDVNGAPIEDIDTTFIDHDSDPATPVIAESDITPTTTDTRSFTDLTGSTDDRSLVDSVSDVFNSTVAKSISKTEAAILDVETMNIVLSALKRTAGAEIVSNPKIVVASGEEDAFFSIGDREPIIKTEITQGTQDSPGDTITGELDTALNTEYIVSGYLQTGISLKVIPVVKTDSLIEAAIEPRLVEKAGDKSVGGNSWPILTVKEIKTVFTLRSGQTVAIGGLTDVQDGSNVSKIPVLGDIPFLGKYLFTHTSESKRRVETVIFVTLTIADPELLYNEVGIPSESELIHKKMIHERSKREEFESELEQLEKASNEETSRRARSRLLRRSE